MMKKILLLVSLLSLTNAFNVMQPSFITTRAKTRTSSSSSSSSLSMASDDKVCNIAIFGGGTVGGGIVEILQTKREYIQQLTGGKKIDIKKICVRDLNKKRDFTIPDGCVVTDNYDEILNDDNIDIVVEVMGGTTDAKHVVYEALKKKKNVVTANKALIAAYLPELEKMLTPAPGNESPPEFRYEAAVCGGIPIIRSMLSDYPGDDISMLSGIINGCTNFMLTGMDQQGMTYDEVLKKASELGYAEADPTLDVGGFDARSKLRILIRLAFGLNVEEEDIACRGITDLAKLDFQYAKMMGGTIKLIGVAKIVEKQDNVAAFVSPCYVTASDPLSSVNGATNAVEVLSKNLQASTYIGEGAGRFPTANSCINDIVALAAGQKTNGLPFNAPCNEKTFVQNYNSVFYIRIGYRDMVGITRQCGEICERHHVSIHSILQNPVTSRADATFVLITEKVPLVSVKKVCADIEELNWCNGPTFYMPVLREDWVSDLVQY
jgi:homoserine dehydrogenase